MFWTHTDTHTHTQTHTHTHTHTHKHTHTHTHTHTQEAFHRVNGIVMNSPLLPQVAGFSLNQCSVLLVVTGHA